MIHPRITNYRVLLLSNALIVISLILMHYKGILPLGVPDFVFITFLLFLFAMYRPRWAFYLFIGLLPLELINLAPTEFLLSVRPYQLLGGILFIAALYKIFVTRTPLQFPRITIFDYALALVALGGLLNVIFGNAAIVHYITALSFFCFYILTRIMVNKKSVLKKLVPFFLSSTIIIALFGIFQNWRFLQGLPHGEIFPGRPNATFTEPDWFGLYIVVSIVVICAMLFYYGGRHLRHRILTCIACKESGAFRFLRHKDHIIQSLLYGALLILTIALTITVARSAWLGAVGVLMLFTILTTLRVYNNRRNWAGGIKTFAILVFVILVGVNIALSSSLTNFELGKRVASTTGLQEITISCVPRGDVAGVEIDQLQKIENLSALDQLGCRHINLEEIDAEVAFGNSVKKIQRNDPNVMIRKDIYAQSWNVITQNWLFGIGWGSAATVLGDDPRGTPLNSSNIFLQVWLATGLLGIVAFSFFLLGIISTALQNYFTTAKHQTLSVFTVLALSALIIPNLFNAGMLLGFTWVLFGILVSIRK